MVKLENLIGGMDETKRELQQKAEQYTRDLEQSRLAHEKPFEQEAELKEKTARLNEVNAEFDLENAKVMAADLNEEGFADSRVAEPENSYGHKLSGRGGR